MITKAEEKKFNEMVAQMEDKKTRKYTVNVNRLLLILILILSVVGLFV